MAADQHHDAGDLAGLDRLAGDVVDGAEVGRLGGGDGRADQGHGQGDQDEGGANHDSDLSRA